MSSLFAGRKWPLWRWVRSFPAALAGVVSGWARTNEEALMSCMRAAPVPAEQVSAWASEDGVEQFGLYQGQRLVAFGELWVDEQEAEVELARLIVDPGVRRQGLGQHLAAGLARLAPGSGIRGCSCGSIQAIPPPFAVMPPRAWAQYAGSGGGMERRPAVRLRLAQPGQASRSGSDSEWRNEHESVQHRAPLARGCHRGHGDHCRVRWVYRAGRRGP